MPIKTTYKLTKFYYKNVKFPYIINSFYFHRIIRVLIFIYNIIEDKIYPLKIDIVFTH